MNRNTRNAFGIAVAAFALAATAGCGSEVATAPNDFDPGLGQPAAPVPGDPDEQCFESAVHREVACPAKDVSPKDHSKGDAARPGRLPDAWS